MFNCTSPNLSNRSAEIIYSKLRSKFETLRREIKADVKMQHDLYVNSLVDDIKTNPRD